MEKNIKRNREKSTDRNVGQNNADTGLVDDAKEKNIKKAKTNVRVQQGLITKQKLYDSAARLFSQYSFEEVSVEDITREVGVTKGTFYVHFTSKDALIADLIREYTTRTDMHYREFLQTLPNDLATRDKILVLTGRIADEIIHTIGYQQI